MGKDDFKQSGICEHKISEILNLKDGPFYRVAYRAIKYGTKDALMVEDFLPTFIEHNHMKIPADELQEGKKDIAYFGTSLFTNLANLQNVVSTIPSMRKSVKFYAVGATDHNKGKTVFAEDDSHFQ